jgi:rhodanese-related sulfurtransferase
MGAGWAAVTAIPLGIAFGFLLERAGLGDPRVIAGQLIGRDFTVLRVMMGAIVTAMLGLVWLGATGAIEGSALAMPPTDIGAQALGAVLFGGGFALASLCPGTACVAAATGRRHGLAAVAGLFAGTALTPLVWPLVRGAAADVPREGARLPEDLGVPLSLVVFGVTVLAVVMLRIARRVERGRAAAAWRLTSLETVAVTLAVLFPAVQSRPAMAPARLAAIAGEISCEEDHVDALELAEWIRDRRPGLRIVDVREGLDSATYRIPGARAIGLDSVGAIMTTPGGLVVLYSDGGAHAAQAWVLLRARGLRDVKVLKDGMAAWEDEVLSPAIPAVAHDSARQRFDRARALALWFGGHPRLAPVPNGIPATPAEPRRRRRNTC